DAAFRELVPPTDATGRVTDTAHTYAPPKDTALRPYRYGPAPLPSPWAALHVATPAPIVPAAVIVGAQDQERALATTVIGDLERSPTPARAADEETDAGRVLQVLVADHAATASHHHHPSVDWDLP
ncbi:MAG: hypothetical protein ABIT64_01520, partial [Lysobacteraceae bacterium]